MTECPNPECRKNLEGARKTLYGYDGTGGLVRCVTEKLSKKVAIAFMVFFISTGSGFVLYGMDKNGKQHKEINQNAKQIEVIKTEMKHIKNSVENLKQGQNDIRKNQIRIEQIKSAVKDALKESRKEN